CLRCRYRGFVPEETFPVLGPVPGIIGSLQACEVIKYIVGTGELLLNRLLKYDGLKQQFLEFLIKPNPDCDHCGQATNEKEK
ncbi:MAG TPA: ThiF family adenylyltransferase, partial [Desulfohalobiaceae bacterium]|nr:ThiF family adenylyltransferase [Desulfohalobiaceae bacterium]